MDGDDLSCLLYSLQDMNLACLPTDDVAAALDLFCKSLSNKVLQQRKRVGRIVLTQWLRCRRLCQIFSTSVCQQLRQVWFNHRPFDSDNPLV